MWKPRKSREGNADWAKTLEFGILSDVGCCRETNEDAGTCFVPKDAEVLAGRGILAVVADGVGGHSAGEVASRLAVDVVVREYYRLRTEPFESLRHACDRANRAIYRRAMSDKALQGMGTTCVALVLRDSEAWCASIGDSRLYLLRDGCIYLMTQDDSMVMDMVRQGLLKLEEARHHPDKNVILRALGTHEEASISVWDEPFPVRQGDRFVLCSDGLYDLVEDEEIWNIAAGSNPQSACRELVDLARARGGHDNITVSILATRPPDAPPPQPRETRSGEALS